MVDTSSQFLPTSSDDASAASFDPPKGMFNFEGRAKKISLLKADQLKRVMPTISRNEHWRTTVTDKDSAFEHFKLYYPDKPEIVLRAYALKISELVKAAKQGQLSDADLEFLERHTKAKDPASAGWDPAAELHEEKIKGLTQLACTRMEELLADEVTAPATKATKASSRKA